MCIECGPEAFKLHPRARGALIGSRIAVALGRVPVLDAVAQIRDELESQACPVKGGRRLAIATYVGYLFSLYSGKRRDRDDELV